MSKKGLTFRGLSDVPKTPTPAYEEELGIYEKKERIRGLSQDIDERKIYAKKTFRLVSFWISGVFLLLILCGLKLPYFVFELPESLLLAVIGGTTLNILGVFIFVMKYLFELKRGP